MWLQEVYDLPKTVSSEEMRQAVKKIWEKVLTYNQPLNRENAKQVEEYHLLTDWCQDGFGYILYAGNPSEGRVVGINSKKTSRQN